MKFLKTKKNKILLLILAAAFILRFAGISWGLPFHFHPDEWNMAAAVGRLSWENKLNPDFFAYGQFPLYLAYFSAKAYNLFPWIELKSISTGEAIFFLRFWSAAAGGASVYLVYLISKHLLTANYSLIAALLAAFTPGLIQTSHFGTTESLLGFFFLLLVYLSFKILKDGSLKEYFITGVTLGLALGTKISSLLFITPILLAAFVNIHFSVLRKNWLKLLNQVTYLLFFVIISVLFFILSSPYVLLKFEETKRVLAYETQVAIGQIPVFYTRQFINTKPIVFQLTKIFPFALGPTIFFLSLAGLIYSFFLLIKNVILKRVTLKKWELFVFFISFFVFFLYQSFLFCKWTRFMTPIFAFFAIFFSLFLQGTAVKISNKKFLVSFYLLLVSLAILPGILFSSTYFKKDIRFTASEWIFQNIPSGSRVLSETGNVIDIPILPEKFSPPKNYRLSLVSFDFYELDNNERLWDQLLFLLENSDYVFVPSRRIFTNHLRLAEKYPKTSRYYELLFSGELGFMEIKKFSQNPLIFDELAEETWSVFDHPTIRIFKKESYLDQEEYAKLFSEN